MNALPEKLYSSQAVSKLDSLAINEYNIPGYTLMRRAGKAVVDVINDRYPSARKLLVICGAGNNAGDGYVVARLASQNGMQVKVISLVNPEQLKGDALQAYDQWIESGELSPLRNDVTDDCDIIVDAMIGTGITRDVSGEWEKCINTVNNSGKTVISVDVPSGLDATTGVIHGVAVHATLTVSFIGLKVGMFTGSGKACSGEVIFNSLEVPGLIYDAVTPDAYLQHSMPLHGRSHDSHKGQYGHVLVVGGNYGMPGAVILAARAALRSGAGMVTVLTRERHIPAVAAACPEAMVLTCVNGDLLNELPAELINRVSNVVIGPGLGSDAWARRLFADVLKLDKPVVIDADALNLLAEKTQADSEFCIKPSHIITPHPGEAARLLKLETSQVQSDRVLAARQLHKRFGGVVVLKGSGTIVFDGERVSICPLGNPAMATAGMGDVLTGVIAAFVAQHYSPSEAANHGVFMHSSAGDRAASGISIGLLATDVIDQLPAAQVG